MYNEPYNNLYNEPYNEPYNNLYNNMYNDMYITIPRDILLDPCSKSSPLTGIKFYALLPPPQDILTHYP
jgi:hypothetical protein